MGITTDNPMAVDGTMLKMLTTRAEAPRGEANVAVAKLWDQERLSAINSEPPALYAAIDGLRRTSLMEDDHIAATKIGRLIVELRRSWNPSAVMMPEGNTATATLVTDAYAAASTPGSGAERKHLSTIFIRADHWSLGACRARSGRHGNSGVTIGCGCCGGTKRGKIGLSGAAYTQTNGTLLRFWPRVNVEGAVKP